MTILEMNMQIQNKLFYGLMFDESLITTICLHIPFWYKYKSQMHYFILIADLKEYLFTNKIEF